MAEDTGPIAGSLGDALTAEDIAAYLREHPDFLIQHPDLIPHLTPPSANRGEGVVDMQYFMLQKLRGDINRLHEQHQELIVTTRANLTNQSRVHAAVLLLLDAVSFEQLIQIITTDLAVLLDVDVAALAMEAQAPAVIPHLNPPGVMRLPAGTVGKILGRRTTLLRADVRGLPDIYGGAADLVRSEALVRLDLGDGVLSGLLAFGSREPDMFHPGQATELLCFLARIVERGIREWLDRPA